MTLNLPANIRKAIYVVSTVAMPIMYYLNQQGIVDAFWFGLFSVALTAVTGLAALNVTPDEK